MSPPLIQSSTLLTERTLAEQLQISDFEIEDRKKLLDFNESDVNHLIDIRSFIQSNINEIVDDFYKKQKENTEFALLIGDSETFRRLHSSMHHYVLELFEGFYDADYVNKRLRIGKVHKRIGVSPKLYLSAILQLENIIQSYIRKKFEKNEDQEITNKSCQALHKLLIFDIQFVFDTYIHSLVSEVKVTKDKVEEYAHSLEATVASRTMELERLSRLDPLTELNNQRSFYEHLRRESTRAERQSQYLSLLYIDLNNFKDINDTDGHKVGDLILQTVAKSMKAICDNSEICCRYGGDEFCMLLPESDYERAAATAHSLVEIFSTINDSNVTLSIGIACTGNKNHVHSDTLIRQADQSMYRAKKLAHVEGGHKIDYIGTKLLPVDTYSSNISDTEEVKVDTDSTSKCNTGTV